MSDTEKDKDQEKGYEVLKRMLKTPPKPHVNEAVTKSDHQGKQDGTPAKKHRPAGVKG